MDRFVVIGGGGHAKVLISVLKKCPCKILGYTDKQAGEPILGVSFIGSDSVLPEFLASCGGRCGATIGLGKIDASAARLELFQTVEMFGFEFPVVVSPQAVVNEEVILGAGSAVFDGGVVNSGTVTGRVCILNTNCTVEHDCCLGDNVHVAPGATLSGGVRVGENCMIGAGATVIQGAAICAGSLIGAGSTVVRDITIAGIYAGNPARRVA
jgi:sugar O-acyltransferase (sialic acid O-acetyltransferase NeuD family)